MLTQMTGLVLARPHTWRLVLLASTGLSVVQLLLSPGMPESPVRLRALGDNEGADAVNERLWVGLPPREGECTSFVPISTYR
jgi:hypothetical protein